MRPKHVLWLVVAVLCLTWYTVDPQARFGGNTVHAAQSPDSHPPGMNLQSVAQARQDPTIPGGL